MKSEDKKRLDEICQGLIDRQTTPWSKEIMSVLVDLSKDVGSLQGRVDNLEEEVVALRVRS